MMWCRIAGGDDSQVKLSLSFPGFIRLDTVIFLTFKWITLGKDKLDVPPSLIVFGSEEGS